MLFDVIVTMTDSLEYILTCQICLEDFEETGDHVPRILPCSHSLCEKCLKELSGGSRIFPGGGGAPTPKVGYANLFFWSKTA